MFPEPEICFAIYAELLTFFRMPLVVVPYVRTTELIDGIPAKILKVAAGPCSRLLTPLMNLYFESGVFPDRLKTARITPIFTGGAKFDREKYRPISVLPVVSKIHEQFANKQPQSYAR